MMATRHQPEAQAKETPAMQVDPCPSLVRELECPILQEDLMPIMFNSILRAHYM